MRDELFSSYYALSSGHREGAIHETLRFFRKERILLALVLLLAWGAGVTIWRLSAVEEDLTLSFALEEARTYSRTLGAVHRIYSTEVLARARGQGVVATHDYENRVGAVPLPATLTGLMEKALADATPGLGVLIYSNHPFPSRRRSSEFSQSFSREALSRFASDPSESHYRVERWNGMPVLRYATALVMEGACVECHNAYPRSPRADWKTNDVAGALEIVYPLAAAATSTGSGFRYASHFVIGVTLLGCGAIAMMVTRLRRVSTELNEEVAERTAELRVSEVRFEDISDNIGEVFWIYDNASQSIVFVNRAFERVWGKSCESLLADSTSWREAIHPEDRERVLRAFQDEAARGSYQQQYRIVRPDGTVRWIEDRAYPVKDASGYVPRIVGISEDITLRQEAEKREETLHHQLVDASRMAGMAEVATGVLHNVGNVLNSLNVATTRAKELLRGTRSLRLRDAATLLAKNDGPELARFLESAKGKAFAPYLSKAADELVAEQGAIAAELDAIDGHLQHIVGIVAAQQTFAHAAAYAEEVNLIQLVDDALRVEDSALRKRAIDVVREYESSPTVCIEKHKALQILINLIGNAKQAVEEQTEGPRRIRIRIHSDQNSACVTVEDTGVGIETRLLDRLFEFGFTTKKNGHGFGLHASANAAVELGGSLRAASAGPGRGASFFLELPVHSREEENVCTV